MDKDSSFLFAGLHFDRKKFANDFARFTEKKKDEEAPESINLVEDEEAPESINLVEPENDEYELVVVRGSKRRKFKIKRSVKVEGFNVFRSSESVVKGDEKEKPESNVLEVKKEVNRQIERDALLRKKHGVHISGQNVPSPLQSFVELSTRYSCKPYLLKNLSDLGIKEPSPIQRQAIPVLLSGRECFACAPTGSGKTLAFLFPILIKLKTGSKDGVRAVVICPTRELAAQTTRECKKLAKGENFYIKLMTKELSQNGDFKKMHCDILVSTPLRLQFAIRKRKLNLSRVEYLVLDESDKLFELGFVKQIDNVVKACSNPSIIRSLFSATLPDSVEELARTIMHDAVRVIVGRKNSASASIKQKLVFAGSEEGKLLALRQSFKESLNPPILIFIQSKERAKELYRELAFDNIRVDVIHSDLSQTQREDAIDNFRAGKTWVLIATDVIARGMDFKGINCVINYDFPESASAYIHRIGRTGRAGRVGEAITLYTEDDIPFLRNIANVMASSGCEVPSWILAMPKLKRKKHRPSRESISTKPKDDEDESDSDQSKPSPKSRRKKQRPNKKSISTKSDDQKDESDSDQTEPLPKPRKKKQRQTKESTSPKDKDQKDESDGDKIKASSKAKRKKQRQNREPISTKLKSQKNASDSD